MISVVLALLTAASNATASVLQRRAASQAQTSRPLGLSLIADLARRRIWLAGIAMVVVASLLQAAALATGPIALVQPIFIVELPLTLLLSSYLGACGWTGARGARSRWSRSASGRDWPRPSPAAGETTRLPISGIPDADRDRLLRDGADPGRAAGQRRAARRPARPRGRVRVRAHRGADGGGRPGVNQGAAAFFGTWQLYGVAIAGVGSLFLLQNALQAGSLAASQPMLTVGDALISITYGVLLFGEQLRLGWFLIPEIVALVLIVVGYIEIARSPVATAHDEAVQPSPPVAVDAAASAGQAGAGQPDGREEALRRPGGHLRGRAGAERGRR